MLLLFGIGLEYFLSVLSCADLWIILEGIYSGFRTNAGALLDDLCFS